MLYTVEKMKAEKDLKKVNGEDKKILISQLFRIIKKHLRETDLLGTIGVPEVHSLFSILTMTGYEGAEIVRDRIKKSLEKKKFDLNGTQVNIMVAISITVPQKQCIQDLRNYLNAVRLNHQAVTAAFQEDKKELEY
jgi:GGDEF domain-containing protein